MFLVCLIVQQKICCSHKLYLTVLAIAKQLLVTIFLFKASVGKTSRDLFTLTIQGGFRRTFSSLPAA